MAKPVKATTITNQLTSPSAFQGEGQLFSSARKVCVLGFFFSFGLVPQGTLLAQQPTPGIAAPEQASPAISIDAGDLVEVRVFDTPELSGQFRVDEHGQVNLPAGGKVNVGNMTAGQAAGVIENQLRSNQIMLNPHVNVFVTQSATEGITVLGEVKSPGIYSLLGRHNLYDTLSAAGGPTQNQGSNITITHRADPTHPLVLQVHSSNYSADQQATQVEPGDTVLVSRASIVYIMGDVSKAGAYYIQTGSPVTVLNGITMAGGLLRTSSTKHAEIIRKVESQTKLIPVNLNDVLTLKQTDLVLEAGDILYVPSSEWKRFLQSFGPAAAQAVANAAAISVIAN